MCCGRKKPKIKVKMTRSGLKKRLQSLSESPTTPYGEPTNNTTPNLSENQEVNSILPNTSPYDAQSSQG
jgi:hypothetical protein